MKENNNTLISLITESSNLVNEIIDNGGELTPELEESLGQNEIDLASKLDSYAYVWERLELEANYWKAKADEFARVSKSLGKVKDGLKDRLKYAIKATDSEEVTGNEFRFKLAKTSGKLILDDERSIPEEFKIETVVTSIDKAKLKEALSNGAVIEGASLLKEPSLRKYAAKKGK